MICSLGSGGEREGCHVPKKEHFTSLVTTGWTSHNAEQPCWLLAHEEDSHFVFPHGDEFCTKKLTGPSKSMATAVPFLILPFICLHGSCPPNIYYPSFSLLKKAVFLPRSQEYSTKWFFFRGINCYPGYREPLSLDAL